MVVIDIRNIKVLPSIKKKMINGKDRWDFLIQIINYKRRKIYFFQADSNIWWKPKKIIKETDKSYGVQYGWLFAQIGYLHML